MILVGHNLGSDLSMLVRNGHALPDCSYFDTQVSAQWLYPDQTDYTLEHLALRMTNIEQWRTTLGKLDLNDFENLSLEELTKRCGGDAEATLRLYPILNREINTNGFRQAWNLAMSVLPILATIGGTGMAVNRKELDKRARHVGRSLKKEKAELESLLGIANLNSHSQLAAALFGPFGATPLHKTTQGYSTDRKSLMWARYQARQSKQDDLDRLLTCLLDYAAQQKLHSTYYEGWQDELGHDNRIRSFYSLGRTATGRLASYNANLQNVPDTARELVVPSPGYDYIVSADHAQLELRGAAHISQDSVMLDWLRRGVDMHAVMAARVMGWPEPTTKKQFEQFKADHPQERATGKMVDFATLYGVSAESLAWQIFKDTEGELWTPPVEVQRYIDQFFNTLIGYKRYTTELWYALHRKEWVVCPTGFKWFLPATPEGWRQAMNYPVQRLCSDLMLLGLRALFHALKEGGWMSRVIGTVHDNLVLEVPKRELRDLVRLIRQTCEHPDTKRFGFTLDVPLKMEIKYGLNWAQLEPIAQDF